MVVNISSSPLTHVGCASSDSTPIHVVTQDPADRFYDLAIDEEKWRDRYLFFLNCGLELRSRYKPGWIPSWHGKNLLPEDCEDSKIKTLHPVLDAKRREDGTSVCIKRIVLKNTELKAARTGEIEIGKFLSAEHMLHDPTNHCVKILDYFRDPIDPGVEYIVMPLLRPFNDPAFGVVGEVVDFVTQVIEGTSFMHNQLVAHGDLTAQNIMMDARSILPQGWHFARPQCAPNGVDPVSPLARIDHPVRYIIIDYDYAVRFHPGQSPLLEVVGGRQGDRSEMQPPLYYDAFKEDVFTVGNVFDKDFYEIYEGLDFLKAQIDAMKTVDFRSRPTAQFALDRWLEAKSKLNVSIARWRLRKRNESVGERALLDAIAVARGGFHTMKGMLNPQRQARTRTWSNP